MSKVYQVEFTCPKSGRVFAQVTLAENKQKAKELAINSTGIKAYAPVVWRVR